MGFMALSRTFFSHFQLGMPIQPMYIGKNNCPSNFVLDSLTVSLDTTVMRVLETVHSALFTVYVSGCCCFNSHNNVPQVP